MNIRGGIDDAVAGKVLTAGVQFKNHRGGIGGVIATYEKYFSPFYFIPTYKPQRFKPVIFPYYLYHIIQMIWLLIRNPAICIVHIHGAAKGSFFRKYGVFFIARYLFRKKVIYHSHGSEFKDFYNNASGFTAAWVRHFLKRVDVVICLSRSWEIFFRSRFAVRKIVVLENIVERAVETPLIATGKPADGMPVQLLFLGVIGRRKGIFDLLETIIQHKQQLTGRIHLQIAGNGEVEKLLSLIEQEQLQQLVTYKGWVTGEEKYKAIADADVYILPSYNEGLPLSILEAMSYGKAIVATPVGGIPEIVQHQVNGLLVQPGSKDEIAAALFYLIANPDQIKAMGVCSQQLVAPYYAEEVIPKLEEVYCELLND